jgi:galactokinase
VALHEAAGLEFERRFGSQPGAIVRAPGRVNLIGGHTDHNDGFVFPVAIDLAIWVALQPRDDRRIAAYAVNFDHYACFDPHALKNTDERWAEYLKGVAWALQEAGHELRGWDGIVRRCIAGGRTLIVSGARTCHCPRLCRRLGHPVGAS